MNTGVHAKHPGQLHFLNHIRLFRRGAFAGLETALGDRRIAIWDIFASQDEMHQSLENLLASFKNDRTVN